MQPKVFQVLLIEDEAVDARYIAALLEPLAEPRFQITTATTLGDGVAQLKTRQFDVVLLDLLLPDGGWPDSLVRLRGHTQLTPIVVLTKLDEETHGLQAVREGAQDYLVKENLQAPLLVRSIRYAIERQKILECMLESEERYALAARAAYDGLWDWNLVTNEIYYSTRWKTMLGYEVGEIEAHPDAWLKRVHPDDLVELMRRLKRQSPEQGAVAECEHRVRHKDGLWRWLLVRATTVFDIHGEPVRLTGTVTDITPRKQNELALVNQKMILQSIFDTMFEGVAVINPQGEFIRSNPAAERLLGQPLTAAAAEDWAAIYRLYQPDGETPFPSERMPLLRALKNKEEVRDVEMRVRAAKPGLPDRWITVNACSLRDDHGAVHGALAVFHDITHLKQTEKDLKSAHDAAMETARIKAEFLANMSHEIRTPMNAIIGMTGLLLETQQTEEQREFTDTMRQSAESLLALINDILDFSKIEAGKMQLELHPFHLTSTVESVAELLAGSAVQRNVELAVVIEPDTTDRLIGDSSRIRQILLNLIGNAIKFTKDGVVTIEVREVMAEGRPPRLRFEVRDTGIGISRENQSRLFLAFSQGDSSTTRRFGGTGLGLAISRQLVDLMGGDMGLESLPRKGSTFWFELPLNPSEPNRNRNRDSARLPARRGLLAGVCHCHTRAMEAYLHNHTQVTLESIDEHPVDRLLAAVADGRPYDLVILDLRPNQKQALPWAAAIRDQKALTNLNIAILVPFGHQDQSRIAKLPGAMFLYKPLRRERLRRLLELEPGSLMRDSALPQPMDTPIPAGMASKPKVLRSPQYQDQPLHILLAEDNLINQKVTLRQLEKMGYQADLAANGQEAVEAAQRTAYDLILMDCQMPEMDGYEATKAIRQQEQDQRHTLIVALTAHVMEEDRQRCFTSGMDDYLSKPVKKEELEDLLTKWFGGGSRIRSSVSEAALARHTDPIPYRLRMIADGNAPLLRELIDLFVRQTNLDLHTMDQALKAEDFDQVGRIARRCAGSSANYGWESLAHLLQNVHLATRRGDANTTAVACEKVVTEFNSIRSRLKQKETER